MIRVRVPTALREHCGGQAALAFDLADGAIVGDVLDRLADEYPALERRLRDEQGNLRRHVNVFVGAENIRDLSGVDTVVTPGSELSVLPAVSGG